MTMRVTGGPARSRSTKAAMASGRFAYWWKPPRCHAASKFAPPTSMPMNVLSGVERAGMILLPCLSRQGRRLDRQSCGQHLLPSGCPAPLFAIEAGPEIPTVVKDLSRKPGSPAPKHLIFEATGTYDPV